MNEYWPPEKRRAYQREWIKRPDVKARRAAYMKDYLPKYKERKRKERGKEKGKGEQGSIP